MKLSDIMPRPTQYNQGAVDKLLGGPAIPEAPDPQAQNEAKRLAIQQQMIRLKTLSIQQQTAQREKG